MRFREVLKRWFFHLSMVISVYLIWALGFTAYDYLGLLGSYWVAGSLTILTVYYTIITFKYNVGWDRFERQFDLSV